MSLFLSSDLKPLVRCILERDQPLLGSERVVLAVRKNSSPGGFHICFINCRKEYYVISTKTENSSSLNTWLAILGEGLAGEGMFCSCVGKGHNLIRNAAMKTSYSLGDCLVFLLAPAQAAREADGATVSPLLGCFPPWGEQGLLLLSLLYAVLPFFKFHAFLESSTWPSCSHFLGCILHFLLKQTKKCK